MNKFNLIVPKNVRYISEWQEYNLNNFSYPHILDKVLTGCGYTEYCLRNEQDMILCSPRRMLLENKESQHQGEVYYFRNDLEQIIEFDIALDSKTGDKEAGKLTKKKEPIADNSEIRTKIFRLKEEVKNYYLVSHSIGKPAKVIVTYDSFRYVRDALIELIGELRFLNEIQVVVDEFQSIFIDAKFKSESELELLHHLQDLQKVCLN